MQLLYQEIAQPIVNPRKVPTFEQEDSALRHHLLLSCQSSLKAKFCSYIISVLV